jgi:hypothetical protein
VSPRDSRGRFTSAPETPVSGVNAADQSVKDGHDRCPSAVAVPAPLTGTPVLAWFALGVSAASFVWSVAFAVIAVTRT